MMLGSAAAYLVAISAMLFSAFSVWVLISTVRHLDPPEAPPSPKQARVQETVAV